MSRNTLIKFEKRLLDKYKILIKDYFLSSNHINYFLEYDWDFNDEDIVARFIGLAGSIA